MNYNSLRGKTGRTILTEISLRDSRPPIPLFLTPWGVKMIPQPRKCAKHPSSSGKVARIFMKNSGCSCSVRKKNKTWVLHLPPQFFFRAIKLGSRNVELLYSILCLSM